MFEFKQTTRSATSIWTSRWIGGALIRIVISSREHLLFSWRPGIDRLINRLEGRLWSRQADERPFDIFNFGKSTAVVIIQTVDLNTRPGIGLHNCKCRPALWWQQRPRFDFHHYCDYFGQLAEEEEE